MFIKRNPLWIYLKIFVTSLIIFTVSSASLILFQRISNELFNTSFIIDYSTLDFSIVIPLYLFCSLLILFKGIYITKGIRIDDIDMEVENIMHVMDNMKWKLREENENTIIFRSPFAIGLWMDEIVVEFIDNVVHITGPRDYVNRVIKQGKYQFTSYEIKKIKQEDEMNGRFTSNFYKKKY